MRAAYPYRVRSCLLRIGIIFGVTASASGCGSAPGSHQQVCTLVGCVDNFSATAQRADGSFPSGAHRVEVLADGVSATCTFTFSPDAIGSNHHLAADCPSGVAVDVAPATICITTTGPNNSSSQCDVIAGQFQETITLDGTPRQVHVWQYVDDASILDAAAAPSYTASTPNGPDCPPVCMNATVAWTLQ